MATAMNNLFLRKKDSKVYFADFIDCSQVIHAKICAEEEYLTKIGKKLHQLTKGDFIITPATIEEEYVIEEKYLGENLAEGTHAVLQIRGKRIFLLEGIATLFINIPRILLQYKESRDSIFACLRRML